MRRNPLYRALRVDKMTLAALDAVLLEYEAGRAAQGVPVQRMLALTPEAVRARAEALASALASAAPSLVADVRSGESAVGGGAAPAVGIPTALIALTHRSASADRLAAALRAGEPPVIVRVAEDRVLVDLRTVEPADEPALLRALGAAAAVLARVGFEPPFP
jgi:L-seryl-tRNA(Ser) seleniumtransferase